MGRSHVSNELEEVGKKLKKLLMTPYPACLNDDHKQELKKTLEIRQKLYTKKRAEEYDARPIIEPD
jgi:hypothetical protein